MVPESGDPFTILRVEDPADAVMVTDIALDACQVSVTLWPVLIEVELAERVTVGATFGLELPHEIEPQTANREAPQEIQRNGLLIIRRLRGLSGPDRARIRCWGRPGGCCYKGETDRPRETH